MGVKCPPEEHLRRDMSHLVMQNQDNIKDGEIGLANGHSAHCNGEDNQSEIKMKQDFEALKMQEKGEWIRSGELSMSLPNLADGTEVLLKRTSPEVERNVRNSLSNIFDKPPKFNGHDVMNICGNGELSASLLRAKALSAEDCPTSTLEGMPVDFDREKAQEQLLKLAQDNDFVINVGQNNNRLSAVLENLPLIYIPHTKQLIPATSENGSDICPNQSSNQPESITNCTLSNSNPIHPTPMQSTEADLESSQRASLDTSLNSTLTDCILETASRDRTVSCTESEASSVSVCLSQGSTSSTKSDNTVIDSVVSTPQVSSLHTHSSLDTHQNHSLCDEDADSESVNELTKLQGSLQSSPANTLDSRYTSSASRGDGSSFSSISSLGTNPDISVSATTSSSEADIIDTPTQSQGTTISTDTLGPADDQGFVEINLHSRNSYERSRNSASSQDSGIADVKQYQSQGAKPKRKGLANFLTSSSVQQQPPSESQNNGSLFSRTKTKEAPEEEDKSDSPPGWKLFGKVPPKQAPEKDPQIISQEYQAKCRPVPNLPPVNVTNDSKTQRVKKSDVEVLSTTALILENRPQGLPCKDPEEALKHRQMYEEMVEAAKKKEQKDAKLRKKQLVQQLKHEDEMAANLKIWNTEVLTNWDTMRHSKRVRDMWWHSIPPSVRGRVWKLAIGNDLNLTPELYHICLNRAKERLKLIEDWCGDTDSISSHMSGYSEHSASREASVELIKLDVSRTFPQLCIFQKGGPYHELLQGLLGAYACYRPDVGYVQGMSFIAAVLLLNMEVEDAFSCFSNLLNRPCQIAFFRLDETLMRSYFDTYEEFFVENLPKLYEHFKQQNLTPDLYIIDWMFTLYAKSLPLDVASRVWDVFCRDGEEFLFRTALGILKLYEEVLLNMDFIHLAQFLTKLPDTITGEDLFASIHPIHMTTDKLTFSQVLSANRESREAAAANNKDAAT